MRILENIRYSIEKKPAHTMSFYVYPSQTTVPVLSDVRISNVKKLLKRASDSYSYQDVLALIILYQKSESQTRFASVFKVHGRIHQLHEIFLIKLYPILLHNEIKSYFYPLLEEKKKHHESAPGYSSVKQAIKIPVLSIEDIKERNNRYVKNNLASKLEKTLAVAALQLSVHPPDTAWEQTLSLIEQSPKQEIHAFTGSSATPPIPPFNCFPITMDEPDPSHFMDGVGISYTQGLRRGMEDNFLCTMVKLQDAHFPLYGIFDGHGGADCANYLRYYGNYYLKNGLNCFHLLTGEDRLEAFFNLFKLSTTTLSTMYRTLEGVKGQSTASFCFVDTYNDELWVSCCGDSRVIIVDDGEAIPLTQDASPLLERGGGKLYEQDVIKRGRWVCKVWKDDAINAPYVQYKEPLKSDVAGYVNMTRAVGYLPEEGINPRSKVTFFPLNKLKGNQKYLVMASDGLWGDASSKHVGKIVHHLATSGCDAKEIARKLVTFALNNGSQDNITVLVAPL